MRREPFYQDSKAVLQLCESRVLGFITASQTTVLFYVLCKNGCTEQQAKDIIRRIAKRIKLIDDKAIDAKKALESEISDYEDAFLAFCAKRIKAQYIITRNEKDFALSPVPALSPKAFLDQFF